MKKGNDWFKESHRWTDTKGQVFLQCILFCCRYCLFCSFLFANKDDVMRFRSKGNTSPQGNKASFSNNGGDSKVKINHFFNFEFSITYVSIPIRLGLQYNVEPYKLRKVIEKIEMS